MALRPTLLFPSIATSVTKNEVGQEGVSHGDGRIVYLGTWIVRDSILAIRYPLVSRTFKNENLPGPMQTGEVEIRSDATVCR